MKVLLWAPIALFALLSLRALAFVAYQGLNGAAFEAGSPGSCTRP